jgi:threonyl-tRNA synthetase
MIEIELKNLGKIKVEEGTSILEAARMLDKKIADQALAAEVFDEKRDGQKGALLDLSLRVTENSSFSIITSENRDKAISILNHSTSHIMAEAIKKVFPDAKFAIGPSIKDGFYYDFETKKNVSAEDLRLIEKEMKRIIKEDNRFEKSEVSKEKAKKLFKGNPYKIELINDIEGNKVSIYTSGDFTDLCSGPHIPSTGKVKAFKLLSVAGAYWRGDEKNKMLVRIYGAAFFSSEELKEHMEKLDLAKRSDHRKIGRDLDIFSFNYEAPGFPFFHPNGMVLMNTILDYWKEEHEKEGYKEIKTPILLSNELWKTSGHWDNYKENMYFVKIDENDFAIKPMNCPGTILVYKSNQHSYRELPIRIAELGLVHRHEKSGVLHGLFRVRSFIQDDAHIFCTEDQAKDEVSKVIGLTDRIYKGFGFDKYHLELSTMPDKRIGTDQMWEKAESILKEAIESRGLDYVINEGEGAFYGPKIDFHIQDCLERTWQCATIQLDFAMPEKFDIEYMGEDNIRHRPVMIHRTVLGSIERFVGLLLEHYSGNLPPWLAPIQVIILPISEKFYKYGANVYKSIKKEDIRVEIDNRVESLSKKIKQAEIKKIPYMVIIGKNEEKTGTITIRKKIGGDIKEIKLADFISEFRNVIENKKTVY